jgi:hypothetical protein
MRLRCEIRSSGSAMVVRAGQVVEESGAVEESDRELTEGGSKVGGTGSRDSELKLEAGGELELMYPPTTR